MLKKLLRSEMIVIFYSDGLNIEIIDVFHLKRKESNFHQSERPFHILTKRLSGCTNMTFGDKEMTVGTDSLLYIPANTEYLRESRDLEDIIAIHFNMLSESLFTPFLIDVEKEKCDEVFCEMHRIWSERKTGYKYRCTALLYNYLSTIIPEKRVSKEYLKLERSIKYIESHLSQKLRTDHLAQMCNICETQYRKLFKKEFGISPVKYINKLRINRAVSMLYSGYYSMSEISELCGFSDQKYFNRIFKSETGKAPAKYKKEYYFITNEML